MKTLIRKILVYIITVQSRLILWRHRPYIIAVTGNVGKTSVKDIIAHTLSNLKIRATKKSENSEIGIPLTIIGTSNPWYSPIAWLKTIAKGIHAFAKSDYPEYLVLEVGADTPGDIQNITTWLKPNIAVLTEFADVPVHIENFANNRDLLVKEKSYLVHAATDLIIYCGDDIDSQAIIKDLVASKIAKNKEIEILGYGENKFNDIVLEDSGAISGYKGMRGNIKYKDRLYKLEVPGVLGNAVVKNCLPALLISDYLEEGLEQSLANMQNFKATNGRMKVLPGVNGSVIIDDTYNASPKAVTNALSQLQGMKGRRIAVLGDMLELGSASEAEHKRIGMLSKECADVLITVGLRSRAIAEGALDNGMKEGWILECDNSTIAGQELLQIIKNGDVMLVKGSQGMRMEKVVEKIVSDTVNKNLELVRQDVEWQRK